MQYWRFLFALVVLATLIACEPTYPERSHVALSQAATRTAEAQNVPLLPAAPTRATALAAVAVPTEAPTEIASTATASPQPTHTATASPTSAPTSTSTAIPTTVPTETATPFPTATFTPSPEPTIIEEAVTAPTAIASDEAAIVLSLTEEGTIESTVQLPEIACSDRVPSNDLLEIVTRNYAISASYEPDSLVTISDYFGVNVTLGYGTQVRAIVLEPLQALIAEMHFNGLKPTVISGYRSYHDQYIAWRKWNTQYPDRADILSAPPGTSEHQLGTTVDFGSPELNNEFHTYFYKTAEGSWLLENAHRYGFTLSYPLEAYGITQFYYEPWHYRYVGIEMATMLFESEISLTEYQLASFPPPCVEDR